MNTNHEHEFEAALGLPEELPAGEHILWQGAPDWRVLAVEAFHVRKLAIYFAAMLAVQAMYLAGEPGGMPVRPLATSVGMALLALLLLSITAYFSARTTMYTLTDKRVVMRVGIVLTLTFNLPLKQIAGAALRPEAKGFGDIALTLKGSDRIAYLNLWPHARPWELKNPQPSLRCLANVAGVAQTMQQAWRNANPDVQLMGSESVSVSGAASGITSGYGQASDHRTAAV
ncbi:photosynthetic complex putative assembly protein PuhB [Polaromonas sp. YR568]|uniref:photosynthetic complex putative assembly protein PuhB n=1 Tax=Polaromonas sp. YR568 TaxID=1855301 RepID=UPI00313831A3